MPDDDASTGADGPDAAIEVGADAGPKLVFVTSERLKPEEIGGLAGADARCNELAADAGRPGSYMAWLSTEKMGESPSQRFTKSGGPYVRRDNVTVAKDYAALTTGPLENAINVTETGVSTADFIWTATTSAGQHSAPDCGGWSSNVGNGAIGKSGVTTAAWSLDPDVKTFSCSGGATFAIYCFEQ